MSSKKGNQSQRQQQTPNLPAQVPTAPAAMKMPVGFKVKRAITLPSLSIKSGAGYLLKIQDAFRVSKVKDKVVKNDDGTERKPRDPATICNALDCNTGEQYIFLVPAVVKENLTRDFPDNTYVGKVFWIQNMGKRQENQRYFDFSIIEAEEPPKAE